MPVVGDPQAGRGLGVRKMSQFAQVRRSAEQEIVFHIGVVAGVQAHPLRRAMGPQAQAPGLTDRPAGVIAEAAAAAFEGVAGAG